MNIVPCTNCGGTGFLYLGPFDVDPNSEDNYEACPECDGLGELDIEYGNEYEGDSEVLQLLVVPEGQDD